MAPLVIPPQLLDTLLPVLEQASHPPAALWAHTDIALHGLLSAFLAGYTLPRHGEFAYVDTLEFATPAALLQEAGRLWDLPLRGARPADRGAWEHVLGALERSARGQATAGGEAAAGGPAPGRVLVVDHAEGLKFTPGGLGGLLLGLSEMTTAASVTVVFLSAVPWDYVRPLPSHFPEPVHLSVPAFNHAQAAVFLAANAPIPSTHPFALHLAPFHQHLLSLAFSAHPSPLTLLRLAHALWPIYSAPLVATLPPLSELEPGLFVPLHGGKTTVLDLVARAKPAFRIALEDPARVPASVEPFAQRARAVAPLGQAAPSGGATTQQQQQQMQHFRPLPTSLPSLALLPPLPRYARYLLLAAYLAAFAAPSKDLRLFSRARHDGPGRVKGGGVRKTAGRARAGGGLSTRVPQSLVGPRAVPLDRLLAVWGALVVEHERPPAALGGGAAAGAGAGGARSAGWEDEVSSLMGSAGLRALIASLTHQHLLQRPSAASSASADRLDGAAFKPGIGWDEAGVLGRSLGVHVGDYWGGDE